MSETVLFKVSSEDKRALEREAKRNVNVSAYIRQRLFVHNYISEADEREY